MKYAIVNGEKRTPQPRLSGVCQICDESLIAKCGKIRVWHWAHKPQSTCNHWQVHETEWHIEWKNRFPVEFQEVVCEAENGERHIADVKTSIDRVLEIQHSPISLEERRSREEFYVTMAWVVDGNALQTEMYYFESALNRANILEASRIKLEVPMKGCSILKKWVESTVSVYLDFGDSKFTNKLYNFQEPTLWRVFPGSAESHATVAPVFRDELINSVLAGGPVIGILDPNFKAKIRGRRSQKKRQSRHSHPSSDYPLYEMCFGKMSPEQRQLLQQGHTAQPSRHQDEDLRKRRKNTRISTPGYSRISTE